MSNHIARSLGWISAVNKTRIGRSRVILAGLAGLGLLATTLIVAAQQKSDRANIAHLPNAARLSPSDGGPVVERKAPPGVDIRALLKDPAVRNFRGLAENDWDFTDPNGVPGFGPLPPQDKGASGQ
jgi:hypothetical protein